MEISTGVVMKGLLLAAATMLTLSSTAFAGQTVIASLPSPTADVLTGIVEAAQPECECPPIVVLVDGAHRTVVSASPEVLKTLAAYNGRSATLAGTVETYVNETTGAKKYVIDTERIVSAGQPAGSDRTADAR
jgi:hypothetical protein